MENPKTIKIMEMAKKMDEGKETEELVEIQLNMNNPYEKAIAHLLDQAMGIYHSRIEERGDGYQSVWKEMTPDEHAALISVKARRLKHAVMNDLPDEEEENQVDLLNYVFFMKAIRMMMEDSSIDYDFFFIKKDPRSEDFMNFIKDIEKVYKKHGLSLGHEDSQGAFLIEPFSEGNIDWLRSAFRNKYVDWNEEE